MGAGLVSRYAHARAKARTLQAGGNSVLFFALLTELVKRTTPCAYAHANARPLLSMFFVLEGGGRAFF